MEHYERSKAELISSVLLWTPTHGHNSVGWPARTNMHQLSADTGCSIEDQPGVTDNRYRLWESGNLMLSAWLNDSNEIKIPYSSFECVSTYIIIMIIIIIIIICTNEMHEIFWDFWDTNGSPNQSQKTTTTKKKKESALPDSRVKVENGKKLDQYYDLARELK